MSKPTIGVLALQGAFSKHIEMLEKLNVAGQEVRSVRDLISCDGLIIPGGESTTMFRLIETTGLEKELRAFAESKPVFGTCAGLILMSSKIEKDPRQPFEWLNVTVERNAFGRQIESFQAEVELHLTSKTYPFMATFIRAPRIRYCGPDVKILGSYCKEPILVRQGHYLGATFHPELSEDPTVHTYFLKMLA